MQNTNRKTQGIACYRRIAVWGASFGALIFTQVLSADARLQIIQDRIKLANDIVIDINFFYKGVIALTLLAGVLALVISAIQGVKESKWTKAVIIFLGLVVATATYLRSEFFLESYRTLDKRRTRIQSEITKLRDFARLYKDADEDNQKRIYLKALDVWQEIETIRDEKHEKLVGSIWSNSNALYAQQKEPSWTKVKIAHVDSQVTFVGKGQSKKFDKAEELSVAAAKKASEAYIKAFLDKQLKKQYAGLSLSKKEKDILIKKLRKNTLRLSKTHYGTRGGREYVHFVQTKISKEKLAQQLELRVIAHKEE